MTGRAMLFLDRDGTLMEDVGYPNDPAQVRLIPGAAQAVRELVQLGFVPAVVSNQSGLARGLCTPEQATAVHQRFVDLFEDISGVRLPCYYCPHGPDDGCDCRKPKPGLLRKAAAELNMVGKPGLMVGDKESDVYAGWAAGYYGVLIPNQNEYPFNWKPDWAVFGEFPPVQLFRRSGPAIYGWRHPEAVLVAPNWGDAESGIVQILPELLREQA